MNSSLKATLAAVLLSSIAVVPAATISVLVSADSAYAKSENAGGKGKGSSGTRGKSGEMKGGKSKASKSKGGSGKSLSSTRAGKRIDGMLRKLTGQEKRKQRVAKVRTPKTDLMHPSNLGNMNGAMNANINAVLAHIKNGNTNGPVGHLAALAVANVNAEGDQAIIDLRDAFDTLYSELDGSPYGSVAEYYEARQGVPGIDPIIEIDEAEDQDQEAIDRGFTSYQDYLDQVAGTPGVEPIGSLDDAIRDLGGNPGDDMMYTDITETEPDPEDVAQAEADVAAQGEAEENILSFWNKNTGDEDAEAELLEKLNERLAAEDAAIRDAMGVEDEEEETACEGETCEEPLDEEDVVLIVE